MSCHRWDLWHLSAQRTSRNSCVSIAFLRACLETNTNGCALSKGGDPQPSVSRWQREKQQVSQTEVQIQA